MSNQPEQIPMPGPPAENVESVVNPYANRNHDDTTIRSKNEVLSIAGLIGTASGELGRIDQANVGGDSHFIKAKKIDARQALNNIVGVPAVPPVVDTNGLPRQQHAPRPTPVSASTSPPEDTNLSRRVVELERIVESYKKIVKFKRGISYNINTSSIKGEFKSPSDILDVISSEMAKGTKTITLKLNDTSKNR